MFLPVFRFARDRAQIECRVGELITLTFRPVRSESPILVRGTYFRICADRTLRGPDNDVTASYANGVWQLGRRRNVSFECEGPVHLRVMGMDGLRVYIGPYAFIKAAEGAIFTHQGSLGLYAPRVESSSPVGDLWREVAFLSSV